MDKRILREQELYEWLTKEFVFRIESIRRCKYFGIAATENEYALQSEAYDKEQEYRKLKGLPQLPDKKELFVI